MKSNSDKRFVDFDFKDAYAQKNIEDWLRFNSNSLKQSIQLQDFELKKIAEFFELILADAEYKIPKNRTKREHSWKELICWYVLKAEQENPHFSKGEAKEFAALKFCVSVKTVERFCTQKRHIVETLIQNFGYESVSAGYEHHLSRIKNGRFDSSS